VLRNLGGSVTEAAYPGTTEATDGGVRDGDMGQSKWTRSARMMMNCRRWMPGWGRDDHRRERSDLEKEGYDPDFLQARVPVPTPLADASPRLLPFTHFPLSSRSAVGSPW